MSEIRSGGGNRRRIGWWLGAVACLALSSCGGDDKKGAAGSGGGAGGAGGSPATTKVKAGWIYIGPPGDIGWTYAHDQGRRAVEANLSNVETKYVENVPEGAAAEAAIQQLVDEGHKIIFTTSFGFMGATQAVAMKNPTVKFEHCSGYMRGDNVSTYFGRMHQALFLTGMVAGRLTRTNKIGIPAPHPIPEVIRHMNAFTLGVRSVNPTAEVHVKWIQSWYDPPKEGRLANELLDLGCDVIQMQSDSTAPILAARDRGKIAQGYDSDSSSFAVDTVATSAVWDWGVYYTKRVKAVQDGSWKSEDYWGHIKDGVVKLGVYGPMVPQSVKDEVAAKKAMMMASDSDDVFSGPIKKQDGSMLVPAGSKLTDMELLNMKDAVQGVIEPIDFAGCTICGP